MALETLLRSQEEAALHLGIDYEEVQELQTPRIVMIGDTHLGDTSILSLRAHSGIDEDGRVGKGGIRMAQVADLPAAIGTVEELSVEMLAKLALRGLADRFKGAKGLMVVDANAIDRDAKNDLARQYENLMEAAGLAGYTRDIPAGDVGTNGLADTYAQSYYNNNHNDRFWRACITGKSPEMDGLAFRTAATGWGSFVTQLAIMDAQGDETALTAIQGFGNVGAWHAHFASNKSEGRIRINAISDWDGTLVTNDPAGITVTHEMVTRIGDNPYFQGQKIHTLRDMVARNQPGLATIIGPSEGILTFPTGYFVPAAMGNVITAENVHQLGAKRGVIEAANGPTGPQAHRYLVQNHIVVAPDILTNGSGVDASIKEVDANISGITPPTEQIQKELTATSERIVAEVLAAADRLQVHDLRTAAAAVSIAHLLRRSRPGVLAELLGQKN